MKTKTVQVHEDGGRAGRLLERPRRRASAEAQTLLMAVRYLLDTNTASQIIKGRPPRVRERLLKVPMADVGISVATEAELRFGVERRPEGTKLKLVVEEFLVRVEVLPWDSDAALSYATLRAKLEDAGAPMGNLDLMIAAHALSVGAILVSNDRVFARGPEGRRLDEPALAAKIGAKYPLVSARSTCQD